MKKRILAVLSAILLAGTACGTSHAAGHPARTHKAKPTTHTVVVTLRLTDTGGGGWSDSRCEPGSGYKDIGGASTTITDESGKIIGSGTLGALGFTNPSNDVQCDFKVTIAGVPINRQQYSVEIAQRGKVTHSKAALSKAGWMFSLSLGQ